MIRDATATDIGEIQALMHSVAGFWDDTWRQDVLERAIASPDAVALVHQDGGSINGFVCAHDVGFRAYLSELVVSPIAQHRGVGSGLLSEVERRMAERGCSLIIGDVWRDAESFYRGNRWTPPPVVLLRKRLAGADARDTVAGNRPPRR